MTHFVQRAGRLALALVVAGSLGLGGCKSDSTTTVYGNWTTSSQFGGVVRRGAVSFVANGVAYVGTGVNGDGTKLKDFWAFNPAVGGWVKQADLPGPARQGGVAFAANGKGYVGTGQDVSNNLLGDFWEFTPGGTGGIGSWRQVASMPTGVNGAVGRYGALAATLGNTGYVGFGYDGNTESDMYTFTPPATATGMGTWAPIAAAFPGSKRLNGVAFVVGSSMYVATGTNNAQNVADVWTYNGTAWRQLASLVNRTTDPTYDYSAVARSGAVGFSIGSYGYVATGSTRQDCYQYNTADDTWTKMNPLIGSARNNAVGFGIGNYGYVGTGTNGTPFDDFYQLDPSVVQQ